MSPLLSPPLSPTAAAGRYTVVVSGGCFGAAACGRATGATRAAVACGARRGCLSLFLKGMAWLSLSLSGLACVTSRAKENGAVSFIRAPWGLGYRYNLGVLVRIPKWFTTYESFAIFWSIN